jgi:hypothetical protein
MAGSGTVVRVQLATRIPKALYRTLRLHCVNADTSVMAFCGAGDRGEACARRAKRQRTKA